MKLPPTPCAVILVFDDRLGSQGAFRSRWTDQMVFQNLFNPVSQVGEVNHTFKKSNSIEIVLDANGKDTCKQVPGSTLSAHLHSSGLRLLGLAP